MIRKAYPILAVVAATATAACGGGSSEGTNAPSKEELAQEFSTTPLQDALKNREHFAALCDDDGYPIPGNINNKGPAPSKASELRQLCDTIAPKAPPAPATPPSTPKPTPEPTAACDKDALNKELSDNFVLADAILQAKHFRCLCDDKGYPIVGNINSKGTTASAFCNALKEKGQL